MSILEVLRQYPKEQILYSEDELRKLSKDTINYSIVAVPKRIYTHEILCLIGANKLPQIDSLIQVSKEPKFENKYSILEPIDASKSYGNDNKKFKGEVLPCLEKRSHIYNVKDDFLEFYLLSNKSLGRLGQIICGPQYIGTLDFGQWQIKTILCEDYAIEERIFLYDQAMLQNVINDFQNPNIDLAVVGAHLTGMPLHHQLQSCEAHFVMKTRSAPKYKLYELANLQPPKPGLIRQKPFSQGYSINIEVYKLSVKNFGKFIKMVPAPLGIGNMEIENPQNPQQIMVKGFVCEGSIAQNSIDISRYGGWREYMQHRLQQ